MLSVILNKVGCYVIQVVSELVHKHMGWIDRQILETIQSSYLSIKECDDAFECETNSRRDIEKLSDEI